MTAARNDWIKPTTLVGRNVRLVPLSQDHREGLVEAVRDGALWRLWYTSAPAPEDMEAEINRRLGLQAAGAMLPFTVMHEPSGRIVGMTTYANLDPTGPRVEIGYTWYSLSVQRTGLNTEAKLILLEHAFDEIGCVAVEFRTHFLNHQSRQAIERLGAKLDGVLRSHQRAKDGTMRDSCIYSIVMHEWPSVRSHLTWQLDKPRKNSGYVVT